MSTTKRERQKANRAASIAAAEAAYQHNRTRNRIVTYGGIAFLLVLALVLVNVLTGDDTTTVADPTDTVATDDTTGPDVAECPEVDGSSPRRIDFDAPQPTCIDLTASYAAVFDTTEGEVRVELDAASTPGTVNNFVTLARWGYYDGTTIFRTDPSIEIIQGGAPHTESASDSGPGYQISDEPTFTTGDSGQLSGPYTYVPGQLVMARSAGPDSASAQFFFTTGSNAAALNGQGTYVVFGETNDDGLAVLQQIIGLHEADPSSGLGGAPSRTVTINSVTIEQG